ncbi:MAG TPA: pyrroline-5-carboxylate reductase [Candidatus Margulisbacteria bacterium]|nr:MAG: pyrroline-5-carboxylate reductase [Candidatus Margulisbacteria bacterium GWD2_39_127]OGI03906.1 MAG: pyrroline-5-carboxylate reductase [Candidatus Margulisbacteria bacterium GWF2_38_17]HAR61961.1 pyrroline-5-carboxylate reductase [Candidatus Margulisiibacteriota bacterium]
MINNRIIGFIGAGKMAEAIINGIIASRFVSPGNILFYDPSQERQNFICDTYNVTAVQDNQELCKRASVIILAIKPQQMDVVLRTIKSDVLENMLFISIAAGITIDNIKHTINKNVKVIRTMPNTPCLLGYGMTAIAPDQISTEDDVAFVDGIFKAVGKTLITCEDKINSITALSGSGPAFFYEIVESFAQAGVNHHLSYDESLLLITQTMIGAAKMIENSKKTTKELINMVSSPGGTTVAGLKILQDGILKDTIEKTVTAAKNRADELNKG